MDKIYIRSIESSSKGNTIVLFDNHTHLFLDFGAQNTNIETYLKKYNVNKNQVAAALITHYHIDHIRSIGKTSLNNIFFYGSNPTIQFIKEKHLETTDKNKINLVEVPINSKKWIKIPNSNWKIKTFKTLHNATGSIGYVIKNKKKKILYLTDSEPIENKLFKKLNAYIVESNYATEYIEDSGKQWKHVNNKINHMNLYETEAFFKKYYSKKMKIFIFSHLSRNGSKNKQLIDDTISTYQRKGYNLKYINPFDVLKFEESF